MNNLNLENTYVNRKLVKNLDRRLRVKLTGKYLVVSNYVDRGFSRIPDSGARGQIDSFSMSSAARMRRYLRECIAEYTVFITLTYPYGCGMDGERAKRDLKVFMQRYKRVAERARDGGTRFSAFWFMEFQKRGAIHFHIFGTHEYKHKELATAWYEIVGSDDDRHLRAGTSIERLRSGRDGAISYASKYAKKSCQKKVPEQISWVGRFWGVFGLKSCVAADAIFRPVQGFSKQNDELFSFFNYLLPDMLSSGKVKRLNCRFARVYVIYDKMVIEKVRHKLLKLWQERVYEVDKRYVGIGGVE